MYNGHASVFTMWCCILIINEVRVNEQNAFEPFVHVLIIKRTMCDRNSISNSYWNQAVPHKRSNMQTFFVCYSEGAGTPLMDLTLK